MDNAVTITIKCKICEKDTTFVASRSGCRRFDRGESVQSALPELDASFRELMISQICPTCWKELEGEDDEAI